jgi:hypothetical protein
MARRRHVLLIADNPALAEAYAAAASHAALRPRQLQRIKPKRFTCLLHYALVKILMRTSKRDFCLFSFTMHRHHHLTFAALLMFTMIETAPAVD